MDIRLRRMLAPVMLHVRVTLALLIIPAVLALPQKTLAAQVHSAIQNDVIRRWEYECEYRIQLQSQLFSTYQLRVFLPLRAGDASIELRRASGESLPERDELVALTLGQRTYTIDGRIESGKVRFHVPQSFLQDLGQVEALVLKRNQVLVAATMLRANDEALARLRACAERSRLITNLDDQPGIQSPPVLNQE